MEMFEQQQERPVFVECDICRKKIRHIGEGFFKRSAPNLGSVMGEVWCELLTNTRLERKKRFYKKDKDEYFFIPEVNV